MEVNNKITMVFRITDLEEAKKFWDAHILGKPTNGVIPEIMAWGDQLTIPNEIVQGLLDIDPDFPNRNEVNELVALAEKYNAL